MYTRKNKGLLQYIDFIILDIIVVSLTYFAACYIRLGTEIYYSSSLYKNMQVLLIILTLLIGGTMPAYKDIFKRKAYEEIAKSFLFVSSLILIVIVYLYLVQDGQNFSRMILVLTWGISCFSVFIARVLYKKILLKFFYNEEFLPQLLVITESKNLPGYRKYFFGSNSERYVLKGVVLTDYNENIELEYGKKILGDAKILFEYLKDNVVDEAFIDISDMGYADHLAKELLIAGITVHISLENVVKGLSNSIIENMYDKTVLSASQKSTTSVELFIKRLMDIVGSIVGLLITLIAVIIFGPIIYIQSPGPIFYSQLRVGKNGRKFRLYKLRSMCIDADKQKEKLEKQNKMSGFMFKMDDDPRIIPIGHLIRKHSIDELPQFYNVLKGDMSLVGTRPPTIDEWEKYDIHHRARMGTKPGLTGIWQTSGRSDITNFEEVVEMDMKYIREWSILKDISLILKTIEVVITGKGSV